MAIHVPETLQVGSLAVRVCCSLCGHVGAYRFQLLQSVQYRSIGVACVVRDSVVVGQLPDGGKGTASRVVFCSIIRIELAKVSKANDGMLDDRSSCRIAGNSTCSSLNIFELSDWSLDPSQSRKQAHYNILGDGL